MCKETTVKTLYEETKIFGGEIWHNLGDAQNAVQVTCRKYQDDYIIHKRVKVDGAWVVDKRKAGNPLNVTEAQLIRECITLFDELVQGHPSSQPKARTYEPGATCRCGHFYQEHVARGCGFCACQGFSWIGAETKTATEVEE
jgi:hypothetical protein